MIQGAKDYGGNNKNKHITDLRSNLEISTEDFYFVTKVTIKTHILSPQLSKSFHPAPIHTKWKIVIEDSLVSLPLVSI